MTSEFFINKKVKDNYGKIVTILDINDNVVRVYEDFNNYYHTGKLFYNGTSLFDLING